MLHTKFKGQWVLEQNIFKDLYHIRAWRRRWSCDLNCLNIFAFPLPLEATYKTIVTISPVVLEEKPFEIVDGRTTDGRRSLPVLKAALELLAQLS